ncbi:hypothetical protein CPB84DRAFT_1854893 [Gymnopilus junonius]|uniref:Splicing factor 3B subunit 1 domain-containing protein n=1 Tax=Gymnopilus junonius TaxID=109634 RepID=A0A9P5N857_GYMJU|nr:hypothetical protein CPB84DRAFT_1854893 [Gymnopilus junonius]
MSEIAVCAGQFGVEGKDVDTSSSTSFRGQRFITAFPITPPTNNKQLTLSSISISATPSHSRLPSKIGRAPEKEDQTPAPAPEQPMMPIIMNALGIMQDDKHNCYLTDEELYTVLPAADYVIVMPPPGYESSDAAAAAAATGLSPELPTEIPGVGNLAFFKAEDAQYFANILKEENQE